MFLISNCVTRIKQLENIILPDISIISAPFSLLNFLSRFYMTDIICKYDKITGYSMENMCGLLEFYL